MPAPHPITNQTPTQEGLITMTKCSTTIGTNNPSTHYRVLKEHTPYRLRHRYMWRHPGKDIVVLLLLLPSPRQLYQLTSSAISAQLPVLRPFVASEGHRTLGHPRRYAPLFSGLVSNLGGQRCSFRKTSRRCSWPLRTLALRRLTR